MYAHKVIEDLEKLKDKNGVSSTVKKFREFISKSIQFHIENAGEIIDLTEKPLAYKTIFSNEMSRYCIPPFPFIWFEWSICSSHEYQLYANIKSAGCIVISGKKDEDHTVAVIPYIKVDDSDGTPMWFPTVSAVIFTIGKDETQFFKDDDLYNFMKKTRPNCLDQFIENSHEYTKRCSYVVEAVLLLLNCKNISTEKHYPPEALNRKRTKVGKQPLFTYHTLVVHTPSAKHGGGDSAKTGIKHRLHFCRGHFKEYTSDNPLFGKLTGLYWWQPHVRGNKELGVVHKDYRVAA